MKSSLLLLILMFSVTASSARNYYFSTLSGDDSRTSAQAQNSLTPWKTLNRLNSFFSSLTPGDSVLFKRGETFYGYMTIKKSGTPNLPIVIGAYGIGNKPIISGFQNLTTWQSIGDGKYECKNAALGSEVNMLTINDVDREMGRFPNSNAANGGYLTFESHVNNTSITDNQLTSSINWKGAELVVRTSRYIIDRVKITGHSGGEISYSPALSYRPLDRFGYFIQNDIRTLDQFGEWYYDPSSKKMTVYFGSDLPSDYDIKASAIQGIINSYEYNDIVLDNLNVTGANSYCVFLYATTNVHIKDCDISFSGIDGISAINSTGIIIENSIVSNTNNIGINIGHSMNGIVRNNKIKNSGIFKGMGQNQANKSLGIRETGKHNLIEYNQVEASGYIGIRFGGDWATVTNNFVNGFNLTKDDGGGIYTTDNGWARKISGNIIINGVGALAGTSISSSPATFGIYLDDDANKVTVTNNTIANCNRSGIFLHNAHDITMEENTLFNNGREQLLMTHNMSSHNSPPLRNNILKNNILFAKTPQQGILNINTCKNDVSLAAGSMDNNYYCRPLDDNFIIRTTSVNETGKAFYQDCDLDGWNAYYKKDVETKKTPVQITRYKVKALIGTNKFANGEFNTSISGVNVASTAKTFSKRWADNDIDGGTLQITAASAKAALTTAFISIGAVSTAKKYIIGFTVKSSSDTLMYIYMRQAGSPYKILSNNGIKSIVRMNSSRKDYELSFTPTVNEKNTFIFLETPCQTLKWSLDNIKAYEADVTETNPDDSIRFEYNATKTAKNISLDGIYTDPKGNIYKKDIVIGAFSSAILIKQGAEEIVPAPKTAPAVVITSPEPNAQFHANSDVTISASASDADGSVSKVEFYRGNTLIHKESNAPYTWSWQNVPPGTYILTAKATDNDNLVTSSSQVTFSVSNPSAPVVSITAPLSGANFQTNSDVTINASASDKDGNITKVEFYNGNTLIHTEVKAPYTWTWKNMPAGTYVLTAKATDNRSMVTSSPAVVISVTNPKTGPAISIITPTVNEKYTSSSTVFINAVANDADGKIRTVQFFSNTTLLRTEWFVPYTHAWKNVPAGNYTITAIATDNDGLTTSSSVKIVVSQNIAPVINITASQIDADYNSLAIINLNAVANDKDGTITKVKFYNGTTLLRTEWAFPYTYSWKNVPPGKYVITAVATDNNGLSSSKNISVTVGDYKRSISATAGTILPVISPIETQDNFLNKIYVTTEPSLQVLDVRVAPDPANSDISLFISGCREDKELKITVFSLSGSAVTAPLSITSNNIVRLNIASLPAACYILQVISGTQVVNRQFIKQ